MVLICTQEADDDTTEEPDMCAGGCGFYGSKEKRGMCSQCFKKSEKKAARMLERKVTAEEQKVTAEEQKVTAEEQKMTAEEQKVTAEEHDLDG